MKLYLKLLIWLTVFSIAMGFLESSVVVYLREIMYPEGFDFPLKPIEQHLALTEILREAATIIMLLTVGILAGRNLPERFSWFIYCFAIWDLFYYVFLKILLHWPESWMTWDVLFLIPVSWVSPVASPIIVTVLMIVLSQIIIYYSYKNKQVKINIVEWTLLILGSVIVIVAFTWDYSKFILRHFSLKEIFTLPNKEASYDVAYKYIPESFNWFLFIIGCIVITSSIFLIWKRYYRK